MKHRSPRPVLAAKVSYTVISLLFCALGIVLMAVPEFSVPWLGRLLGVGMIVFGVIKLLGYFSRDLFRLAFQYDLAFGVLLIALGVVTLARPGEAIGFLCVLCGIPVLADGLFKIQIAVDSRRFGLPRWWLVMALATPPAGCRWWSAGWPSASRWRFPPRGPSPRPRRRECPSFPVKSNTHPRRMGKTHCFSLRRCAFCPGFCPERNSV